MSDTIDAYNRLCMNLYITYLFCTHRLLDYSFRCSQEPEPEPGKWLCGQTFCATFSALPLVFARNAPDYLPRCLPFRAPQDSNVAQQLKRDGNN